MAARPGLVKLDQKLPDECGKKLGRLSKFLDLGIYTAVNFYSNFPYHYHGPADGATMEIGQEIVDNRAEQLVEVVRAIKADEEAPRLMREFLDRQAKGGTLAP
jgi:creatinine amidohydrolase